MFFRVKRTGSYAYLQIVESFREQRQVRQRVITTLGRLDLLQATGQLEALLGSGLRFCEKLAVIDAHEDGQTEPVQVQLELWERLLRSEGHLAEGTISGYCWWIRIFLQWLRREKLPLGRLTLIGVDRFTKHLASKGLGRVSLAKAATVLRRFLRDAFAQQWCRHDLAESVLGPRLFRHENLPMGPAWPDVQRLIAATEGSARRELRNRAIFLLLAVYGLRSGEVRGLCLEDLDWDRQILRVRRSKTVACKNIRSLPS